MLPDTSLERVRGRARALASGLLLAVLVLAVTDAARSAADGADSPAPLPDQTLAMMAMRAADEPMYLAFEARLRQVDARQRAAVKQWVEQRFDASPTAANRLQLAIVGFLTDRRPDSLRHVCDELRFLASLDDLMSESEQQAASVYLARVEHELRLQRRIAALEQRGAGLFRDLDDAETDIALLKGQVDMLRRQIERLTDIERTIDEENRQAPPVDIGLANDRKERREAVYGDAKTPAANTPVQSSDEDDS